MPGVNADQIAQARSVGLFTYLQSAEPWELRRSGSSEYRTATHSSLVISNGMWIWNRGQIAGRSALDFLIKVRGMGFVEAVEMVLGCGATPVSALPVEKPKAMREQKKLLLPPLTRYPARMLSYLQDRGISADVIRRCIDAGILYESRYNDSPVCVFVGRDEGGEARFACMRGITSDVKRDCVGSNKRYGFCLPERDHTTGSLAVFESPIDALSHCCLFPDCDIPRLSLGGTTAVALTAFLERRTQVDWVSLCLDADDAGQTAAIRIRDMLAERFPHIGVTIDPPEQCKDYNMLLHTKVQERKRAGHRKVAGLSI